MAPEETVTHFKCPENVARELELAGGKNPFGEPMFRCVWGFDRIVPITGEWQQFEEYQATMLDKKTGVMQTRKIVQLVSSVIETRHVPKYRPGNCWHLEKWCPAEAYGSPDQWKDAGTEVLGNLTVDTAGPYPDRGEYELCYPLTDDCTPAGEPIPLVADVVADLVRMIRAGQERFSFAQRRAAIQQEQARQEAGFLRVTEDRLRSALRPYCGEEFVTVPGTQTNQQASPTSAAPGRDSRTDS